MVLKMGIDADISEENCVTINFSETKNFKEKDMRLSFFCSKKPFEIISDESIIPLLKNATKQSKQGFNVLNIKTIIPTTSFIDLKNFSFFAVVLFLDNESKDETTKRKGILIGNSKEGKQFVCGLWPYKYFHEVEGNFQIAIDKILSFIKYPSKISEILLLSKK